jgi:arylsulfatase A-like enzyme
MNNHLAVLLFVLLSTTAVPLAAEKPNILFLFADDVGREVLGSYGGTSYETPHLDALAKTGMQFNHCYSMPVCHPSRVCIMTGVYPARQGNPGWGDFAKDYEAKTFAHLLKNNGYSTAVAGKWQLALMKNAPRHPERLGFDQWSVFGWHEGPRFHDPMIYENGGVRNDTSGKYGPDLYVDFLIDFMKESQSTGKPFFAYYPMALAHDVTDDLKGKMVPFYKDSRWMNYKEMAESMDDMVGRLVDFVDQSGLRKDTVIIFSTDNGTAKSSYIRVVDGKMVKEEVWSNWEDGKVRGGKTEFTDWGTRVPLIVSWEGKIEAGTTADDLVDFSDFLPTLAELTGSEVPEDWTMDGISFAPRLLRNEASPRKWAYSELRGKRFVRTKKFKLYGNGEFFDVATNPLKEILIRDSGGLSPEETEARLLLQNALDSVPAPAN